MKFFTLWAVWSLLQLQLTLIVHRWRICAFVYLIKCACNPHINTWNASVVITKLDSKHWDLIHLRHTCPVTVKQGNSVSYFSILLCAMNKCPFSGLLSAKFLAFLCFLLVILRFKMALSVGLKCYLVFQSARRLRHALWRKCVC